MKSQRHIKGHSTNVSKLEECGRCRVAKNTNTKMGRQRRIYHLTRIGLRAA